MFDWVFQVAEVTTAILACADCDASMSSNSRHTVARRREANLGATCVLSIHNEKIAEVSQGL